MQPINALRSLVTRRLKELGLRRSALAQAIGYRNTNKGMRRVEALLDAQLDVELAQRVAKVLMIPKVELERALEDQRARKEKERIEQEEIEREKFTPSLTLIKPDAPQTVGGWRLWSLMGLVDLPPFETTIPWEEERAEVFRCFAERLEELAEDANPGFRLSGFYYHRSYDHGFLFDTQGNLIREDNHHVMPSSVWVIPTVNIEW